MSTSEFKVALITGGERFHVQNRTLLTLEIGSGIGAAVAEHLPKKGWKKVSIDLREPADGAGKDYEGIFIKTDVTKYEEQEIHFKNVGRVWMN